MGRVLNFPRIPQNQDPEQPEPNQGEDLRDLDLASLAYQENPAPWLHRIRAEEPVFHTRHGYWLLTRYSDVKGALRDPRFSSDWGRLRGVPEGNSRTNANKRLIQSSFNMKDPPEHTRMRSLINLAFAGIAVDSRRNRIAKGSGVKISQVNQLIKQHMQMKKMMKKLNGGGKMKKMMKQMQAQGMDPSQMPQMPGGGAGGGSLGGGLGGFKGKLPF